MLWSFFFFNDTATPEIYTLSLHDALPISRDVFAVPGAPRPVFRRRSVTPRVHPGAYGLPRRTADGRTRPRAVGRSEEHTSELQSRQYLVCRLLLEKKKKILSCICSLRLHT